MSLLQDLITVGNRLDQAAKPTLAEVLDAVAGVVKALESAGIGAPSGSATGPGPAKELSEREQQIVDLQTQLADLAGSERAAVDPAAVAADTAQLHEQIGQLQAEKDPAPAPAAADPAAAAADEREKQLQDEIASLQVQLADAQRAQVTVEHTDAPAPGAPA